MAALENIRKRSVLLLSVIGFAMLAFILGDFMQSQRSGGPSSSTVGEVLGEKINIQNFQIKVEEGIENFKIQNPTSSVDQQTTVQIRNQIWDQYIKELILNNQFSNLGIDVTDDEFFELLQGSNVHPEISKVPAFQDPNTGQFDRSRIVGYLKNIDTDPTGEAKIRWISFQKYLLNQIKESKYNDLLQNSMSVTNLEAIERHAEKNYDVSFNCITVPFSYINDSLVSVSENEINAYYKQNIEDYKQEESKDVDYVVFNVVYSAEDELETLKSITNIINDFKNLSDTDVDLFVRRNTDNTISNFAYKKESEFDDPKFKELLTNNVDFIGPYKNSENSFRIARIFSTEFRPDSVEAQHILITPKNEVPLDSVNKIISNIRDRIDKGEDFGTLAQLFSDDKGSAIKGGDLGWFKEGVMVKEFNDACFSNNFDKLSQVNTQFGVHLINITNRSRLVKKHKVIYIDRFVLPSSETFNKYYSQAAQFANEILNNNVAFDSLVLSSNLAKRSDSKVKKDKENISGLPNSREMVKWLCDAKENQISEVFQFENSFVVAYVKDHHKKGYIDIAYVENSIKSILSNIKKSKQILSKFENIENLAQLSKKTSIKTFSDNIANMTKLNIAGIGFEPELTGHIISRSQSNLLNKIHMISAKNAVYFYEIKSFTEVPVLQDYSAEAKEFSSEYIIYSSNSAYKSLNKEAGVIDNRSLFY